MQGVDKFEKLIYYCLPILLKHTVLKCVAIEIFVKVRHSNVLCEIFGIGRGGRVCKGETPLFAFLRQFPKFFGNSKGMKVGS